ncbi:TPA: hypothetical protein ACQJO1_004671 [Vibrio parahaemolyticus]
MKLVKFETSVSPVCINPSHVLAVVPYNESKTDVLTITGKQFRVNEGFEVVCAQLESKEDDE